MIGLRTRGGIASRRRTRPGILPVMRFRLLAAAALCSAILPACKGPGEADLPFDRPPPEETDTTPTLVTARWPFWPIRMRLHPLSMITDDPETGRPIVEARIELVDEFGHTTKGVGQVRFELYDVDPREAAVPPLEEWNVDIRAAEPNAAHYDPITQTYLFRLQFDAGMAPDGARWLRAYYLSVDGRKFESTMRLRGGAPPR
jgi:hypothetical protein